MTLYKRLVSRLASRDERGDVPGWVMVTVMTIIIARANIDPGLCAAIRTRCNPLDGIHRPLMPI